MQKYFFNKLGNEPNRLKVVGFYFVFYLHIITRR